MLYSTSPSAPFSRRPFFITPVSHGYSRTPTVHYLASYELSYSTMECVKLALGMTKDMQLSLFPSPVCSTMGKPREPAAPRRALSPFEFAHTPPSPRQQAGSAQQLAKRQKATADLKPRKGEGGRGSRVGFGRPARHRNPAVRSHRRTGRAKTCWFQNPTLGTRGGAGFR